MESLFILVIILVAAFVFRKVVVRSVTQADKALQLACSASDLVMMEQRKRMDIKADQILKDGRIPTLEELDAKINGSSKLPEKKA